MTFLHNHSTLLIPAKRLQQSLMPMQNHHWSIRRWARLQWRSSGAALKRISEFSIRPSVYTISPLFRKASLTSTAALKHRRGYFLNPAPDLLTCPVFFFQRGKSFFRASLCRIETANANIAIPFFYHPALTLFIFMMSRVRLISKGLLRLHVQWWGQFCYQVPHAHLDGISQGHAFYWLVIKFDNKISVFIPAFELAYHRWRNHLIKPFSMVTSMPSPPNCPGSAFF